jgi:hypothetical protein
MHLHVTHDSGQGSIRRTAQLRSIKGENDVEIFFEMDGVEVSPPAVLDGFVFGVIFYAMRLGQDLLVRGPVTRSALFNLNEFQEAWVLWRPHLYHKIKIIPESIVDRRPARQKKAIAAFSGGVDSVFTILRHNGKALGNASYPLNDAVLMVHGFDVPLAAPDQLESLKKRTRPLLDELGLKLLTIRTNLRELGIQDWEDSCMAQLACCLNNYSDEFCYALAGSTEAYNALALPWGSNPATDYLLSGDAMRLVHDGAGYSRTEKVAQIATHKTARQVVKVCWEGQDTSRNCGQCEKCIRTQLNFRAVGVENAPCFDEPLDSRLIETMNLRNDTQANELKSIHAYAAKAGINAEWVETVGRRIDKYDNHPSKMQAKNLVDLELLRSQLARQAGENQQIIEGLQTELARRTADYQGITRSISWRATSPIRDLLGSSLWVTRQARRVLQLINVKLQLHSHFWRGPRESRQTAKQKLPQLGNLFLPVHSFYQATFGRFADQQELENSIAQLQSGVSLEVFAEELVNSSEFLARHGSSQKVDTAYLTAFYGHGLWRRLEPERLAHWLAEGVRETTRAKALAAFAGSEEAKREVATLFVDSLYRTAFGRPADQSGLANCVQLLQSGSSLETLAEELVASTEFQMRHGPSQTVDAEYLAALYRDGLGRSPDEQGLAQWLAEGQKAATRAQILTAFSGSTEAIAHTLQNTEGLSLSSPPLHEYFDDVFYLGQNPGLAELRLKPLQHYLNQGWREGRSPHPLFEAKWYLEGNPDVLAAGAEPLKHYLNQGWKEGRSPHPLFHVKWYLKGNPDVLAAGAEPLKHYLNQGWKEGRSPHPLFDVKWYLEHNPDLLDAGVEPLKHYLQQGYKEQRNPHPLFNVSRYLNENPDLQENDLEPLTHYLLSGVQDAQSFKSKLPTDATDSAKLPGSRFPNLVPLRTFSASKTQRRVSLVTDSISQDSLINGLGAAIIFSVLLAKNWNCPLRIITRKQKPEAGNVKDILLANNISWKNNIEFLFARLDDDHAHVDLSREDVFVTTSWSTTWSALQSIRNDKIIYLLQEDERMLYPEGDEKQRCREVMANPEINILVNSHSLYRRLLADGFGRLQERGQWFELSNIDNACQTLSTTKYDCRACQSPI